MKVKRLDGSDGQACANILFPKCPSGGLYPTPPLKMTSMVLSSSDLYTTLSRKDVNPKHWGQRNPETHVLPENGCS